MQKLTLINGNKQPYTLPLPKLIIKTSHEWNKEALTHIQENTGLTFTWNGYGYEAQPTEGAQIAALFMTYNFKTRYYNNWEAKNTLYLKSDHHIGFDVDSICYECAKENRINVNSLDKNSRIAC